MITVAICLTITICLNIICNTIVELKNGREYKEDKEKAEEE